MAGEDQADMEDWEAERVQSDHSENEIDEFQGNFSDMEDGTESEGSQVVNENEEDEDIPSDNDNIWNLPEDQELQLLQASQIIEEADEPTTPFEVIPPTIVPSEREPQSCISCFSSQATVLALPCRHALLSTGTAPPITGTGCPSDSRTHRNGDAVFWTSVLRTPAS